MKIWEWFEEKKKKKNNKPKRFAVIIIAGLTNTLICQKTTCHMDGDHQREWCSDNYDQGQPEIELCAPLISPITLCGVNIHIAQYNFSSAHILKTAVVHVTAWNCVSWSKRQSKVQRVNHIVADLRLRGTHKMQDRVWHVDHQDERSLWMQKSATIMMIDG